MAWWFREPVAGVLFETGSWNRFQNSSVPSAGWHGADRTRERYHASRAECVVAGGSMRRWAVDDQVIRAALERHWSDLGDQDVVHEIYHDDVVVEFPQSGERIVGVANLQAMRTAYPTRVATTLHRILGAG